MCDSTRVGEYSKAMKEKFLDRDVLCLSPDGTKAVVVGYGSEPRMGIMLSSIDIFDKNTKELLVQFPSDAVNWTVIKSKWRDDKVLLVDLEHYPSHQKLIGAKINFEKAKIHLAFGGQQFSVGFSESSEALNKIDATISF